jgi:hypothetical protein
MKKVSILALIALGGLTATVTSCKKEDPAKALEVNLENTATIKGKILLVADEHDTAAKFTTPSNLSILANVNYADLSDYANGGILTVENVSYNAATGEFTIVAPVSTSYTTPVSVKFDNFKGKVTQSVPQYDSLGVVIGYEPKTVNVTWSLDNKLNNPNVYYVNINEVTDLGTIILDNNDYTVDYNAGDKIGQ